MPPKSGQKPAKRRPGVAQEGPRALQNQARRARRPVFSVIFAESSVRPGLEANFASFLRCALDGRYAFRISFNGVLRTSSMSRGACPRARENFGKQGHGASKTGLGVTEILENRERSAPRRRKTGQKRQQTQQEAPTAPKKRPRAKNSANMAPMWRAVHEDF